MEETKQHLKKCHSVEETKSIKNKEENYRLIPTNNELKALDLENGKNDVLFVIEKSKSPVIGRIFLWNWDVRLIVSDIDGTITKSDFRGQIMPLLGNDWSQPGVARLFTEIHRNGYEFLYLSCRPLLISNTTRNYIGMIKQGEYVLPLGPIMVSPNALLSAITMEVLKKNPHKYKIPVLKRITELFPDGCNPFFGAYGNKVTDSLSYKSVGITENNIYLINKKGVVSCKGKAEETTYAKLTENVSILFPK